MRKTIAHATVLGVSLALYACNGWPKAAKLDEAEHKPEKYLTYDAIPAQATDTLTFEGRRWMVEPAVVELHGANLQTVGTAGGTAVYAEKGEASPYNVLYADAGGGKWHTVMPIE